MGEPISASRDIFNNQLPQAKEWVGVLKSAIPESLTIDELFTPSEKTKKDDIEMTNPLDNELNNHLFPKDFGEVRDRSIPSMKLEDDVEVKLVDHFGNDASIVKSARVSTVGANEVYMETLERRDAGLINYLMREKHGSPFEHNAMTFYVRAPIFVFREFQRHRIASYNEMSGRYTDLPGEFYIPNELRPIVNVGTPSKPQMAPGTDEQYWDMHADMVEVFELAWAKYQKMLADGIANELARTVLPLGIFSQMYVTINLRSMFNFLSLRTHNLTASHISRPQREIEMVADKMEKDVKRLFPVAYAAWDENGRVAP